VKIGQSAGKSFAYLLGVYLGDGCVTNVQGYDRFRLNTIDRDFAEATAKALGDVSEYRAAINGPYQDKRFSKSAPQWQLHCGDTAFCALLREMTANKTKLPDWIWTAPKDERLAFIGGLMDSEGFVSEDKNNPTNRRWRMGFRTCDVWAADFVRFLEETDIRTSGFAEEQPTVAGRKLIYRFAIKLQSWVDSGARFNIQRKQQRVDEWASEPAYAQRTQRQSSETARQTPKG
jgi:hypothetical protein